MAENTVSSQTAPAGNAAPASEVAPVFATFTGASDATKIELTYQVFSKDGYEHDRTSRNARKVDGIEKIRLFTDGDKRVVTIENQPDGWHFSDAQNPAAVIEIAKHSTGKVGKNKTETNVAADVNIAVRAALKVIYPKVATEKAEKAHKADASLTDAQKATAERIRWDVAEAGKVSSRVAENEARAEYNKTHADAPLPILPAYVAKPFVSKAEKAAKKAQKATPAPAPVASSAPAEAIAASADARRAAHKHGKK